MSPYENGATEERVRKMPFRPEIYEEPQNVSHEAGQNNSTGASELSTHQVGNFASISSDSEISELEQMLKQMTFTRSVTQHLIALLHSRTIEESPTPLVRLEASTTTCSMKRRKHGDERDNFQASVVRSRVLEEEIAQDLKFISNNGAGLPNPITSTASPQQPATMESLLHELLSNIFIRLFAKQLAQMRSVSKSWNALLSNSSFVKSHLHHSIHNNDQILLLFKDEEESSSVSKPFTAIPSRSPRLELTNFIKLPVNPQSGHTNGIRVIGSVNGLICSSYDNHSVIHIWNPSLSAVLALPPYSTPSSGYNSFKIHFRFGFDPKTDDYKVVKLTGLDGPYENVVTWWLQVEIYSMRKGSWEVITERFPPHITTITNGDYVCVDGHDCYLHWLGYNYISENTNLKMIVAFDLGTETFHEIPLPDSILDDDRENVLGVLARKRCVMTHVGVDGTCDVWVMDKYGVAESWVKRHVFSQFDVGACLFGFTSHNEFLIVDDGHLVLYDPNANEQIMLEDYCPEDFDVQNIMEYVDSLVWVAPAKA